MSWNFITRHRHYGTKISLSGLAAVAALAWVPEPGSVSRFTGVGPVLVLLAGALYSQSHSKHLCEQCFTEMPVNVSEQAEAKRPILRLHHAVNDSGLRVTAVGLVLLGCLVASHVAGGLVDSVVVTVYAALMGGWVWITAVHGRYEPWCPWCHDDGGDDDREDVPTPQQPELV